jgi:hypothetical protein
MEKTLLYQYYWFGTCVRFLQDAKEGFLIRGNDYIIGNIDSFLRYINSFGLNVTSRTSAITKLITFREVLSKAEGGEKATLSSAQADLLNRIMNDARSTLEAEIQGFSVFLVSPKRIDTNKLLDDVPSLFSPNIYGKLPLIAQYDFSEAGRCIAFERSTAAAFHMLRGTEAVLRYFYYTLIKQKRITSLLWGPVVDDLRKRRRTKDYHTLYNNLDNIRSSYRNPTNHPEAKYDIQEAQDLWGLCTEVVNRMMKILNNA